MGGFLLWVLLPDKPLPLQRNQFSIKALTVIFKIPQLRAAAFGYFGHMWELYAFWTFVPIMLKSYNAIHPTTTFNIPLLSFFIIAIGGIEAADIPAILKTGIYGIAISAALTNQTKTAAVLEEISSKFSIHSI